MKYRLLIFDWDGTLVDSIPHIVGSMQAACDEVGVARVGFEACRQVIGLGMKEALDQVFGARDAEFDEHFRRAYARHFFARPAHKDDFFPGVLDTLHHLRGIGYPLAIATGKSEAGMRTALQALAMEDWFVGVQCADISASKPHPLMVERLLAHNRVRPDEALLVGDTTYDLEMAGRAGVAALGVAYGAHPSGLLKLFAPLAVLAEFKDILEYVV